eukprot:95707-Rhodomonas_salina.2
MERRRVELVETGICLRMRYAMRGTEIASGGTRGRGLEESATAGAGTEGSLPPILRNQSQNTARKKHRNPSCSLHTKCKRKLLRCAMSGTDIASAFAHTLIQLSQRAHVP